MPAGAEEGARARPRLGISEGTNDCDTRRPRLSRTGATPHRLHLLARIADGVVTSGRWFRHARQGRTGRARYDSAEGRGARQASRDPRLRWIPQPDPDWACVKWNSRYVAARQGLSCRTQHTGWNDSCRAGLPPAGVRCLSTAHEVISSVPLFDHTEDLLRNGTAAVLRLCGTTPLLWRYHATLVP